MKPALVNESAAQTSLVCKHCGKITTVDRLGVPVRPVCAGREVVRYVLACGCSMTNDDDESRVLNEQLIWCAAQDSLHATYADSTECPCYPCSAKKRGLGYPR